MGHLRTLTMHTFQTSRFFACPPQAVFAAIRSPERLARWWGPAGFSNHFEVFEFAVGGRWVFEMVGPDGTRYPNESVFSDIEDKRRVVIDHVCAPHFRLTITLQAVDGGTQVHWLQAFADAAVAQAVRHMVEPANEQNLDRLGAELG